MKYFLTFFFTMLLAISFSQSNCSSPETLYKAILLCSKNFDRQKLKSLLSPNQNVITDDARAFCNPGRWYGHNFIDTEDFSQLWFLWTEGGYPEFIVTERMKQPEKYGGFWTAKVSCDRLPTLEVMLIRGNWYIYDL